jgi:hypothetical protein
MATAWGTVSISAVTSTGDLTQLYLDTCTAGSGATTMGTKVRKPMFGTLHHLEVKTDGTNGGTIELWDLDGNDGGANVNTGVLITNTQKNTAVAAGLARLMWSQNFTGATSAEFANNMVPVPFQHGMAVRYVNGTGSCTVNVVASGGFNKQEISG